MSKEKIIVEDVIKGEKTLELKTSQGLEFSIHLKSPDISRRKYIESIYYRNLNTTDELDYAHHKHAERIIRSIIKDLKGVYKKDPKTGNVSQFMVEFTDQTKEEITKESYNFIIYFFETQCNQDTIERLFKEYAEMTGLALPDWVQEDDKKKA